MNMKRTGAGRRWPVLIGFTVLGVLAVSTQFALTQQKDAKSDGGSQKSTPIVNTDKPAKGPTEKLYTFEWRSKPWNQVLEWLVEQTGYQFTGSIQPQGSFTFIGNPKGSNKLTLDQVIDTLNRSLLAQKFLIIRKGEEFTIIPSDEKADPSLFERIPESELEKHGNTEIVSVVLQFNSTVADDAASLATKMKSPFGEVQALKGNHILVQDTVGNVKRIRKTIRDIEGFEGGEVPGLTNERVITTGKVNAAVVAKALQDILQQNGMTNQVKIVTPGTEQKSAPKKEKPDGEEQEPRQQIVDPQAQKQGQGAPITITAIGDKLIIKCDDPAMLAKAQQIAGLIIRTPGDPEWQVIRLKNASAVEAARVLDEAFNGPRQQNQGGFGGGGRGGFQNFFQQMAAQGAQVPASPTPGSVRVVADPGSNSLIVKASPIDMVRIRSLLDNAIDSGESESVATNKTWIVGPFVNAGASEIATIIRDVFRDNFNVGSSNTQVGGFQGMVLTGLPFGGGGRGGRGGGNANNSGTKVSLSMGVDDRTNRLILNCNEPLYKDIEKLAKQLDEAAKDATRVVNFIPIKDVDPMLVQEAIDAMQGRRSNFRAGNSPFGNGMGGMGGQFGGGGRGGFQGGGFGGMPTGGFGMPTGGFGGGGFPGGGFGGQGGRGGFNFGGGGAFPGGGFGQGGGGFGQGGGMFPGGGGGRGGRGGGGFGQGGGGGGFRGGQTSMADPNQGPDFFAQRVTDDPESSLLYDPQQDRTPLNLSNAAQNQNRGWGSHDAGPAGAYAGEEEQQAPQQNPQARPGAQQPQAGQNIPSPRSQVFVDALPELGGIVVGANTPQDIEAVKELIKIIQELSKGTNIKIQIVPLRYQDPTVTATYLTTLFSQVRFSPSGDYRTMGTQQQRPQFGGAFGFPGGQAQVVNFGDASVVLLPLPRFTSLLVGAPESRMNDVIREIARFDKPNSFSSAPRAIQLKKASAARVATILATFYNQRFPQETLAQNQIRITYEDSTNTIFVQAAEADFRDIQKTIEFIDENFSAAISEIRIVPLKNALPDELTNLLITAISQGVVTPGTAVPTAAQGAGIFGGAGGGFGGGAAGGFGGGGIPGLQTARPGGATGLPGQAGATGTPTSTGTTKTISLRYVGGKDKNGQVYTAGVLEDIHITPDVRLNSVIIVAPTKSMQLIEELVHRLDEAPPVLADIKVFTLRKADASQTAQALQQLFFGSAAGTTTTPTTPTGGGGAAGTPAVTQGALTVATGVPRVRFSSTGQPEGAPLVELRIAVDPRSNSLIVSGARAELDVIDVIVSKLEDVPVPNRRNEVFHLHNATAADVASTLNAFFTQSLSVLSRTGALSVFQETDRDVIIIPEPFTNKLLISATPTAFQEVLRLIAEMDTQPPQVVIQVLVAEVDLTATEEFGVELGLQSPILFTRSVVPVTGQTSGSTNINNATGGLVGPGVSYTFNNPYPTAFPGLNFNQPSAGLGQNIAGPGIVGFQGLGSLGVGRTNSNGLGGFVFSAASDTFSLLIRALKTQGRIDILSRPQITTTDNQQATILVGQYFPYVTGNTITTATTGIPTATNTVNYRNVGVQLVVTPRVSPDGTVVMRVTPEISAPSTTQVTISPGITATAFDTQNIDTTVIARDGETVALGGLIQRRSEKNENKIPFFGDLPWIGAAFRYRTMSKKKTELLVIMTPHIVRTPLDKQRILLEEAQRMDWIVGDAAKIHGNGLDTLLADPKCMQGVTPPTGLLPGPGAPAYEPLPPPKPEMRPQGMPTGPVSSGQQMPPPQMPNYPAAGQSMAPVGSNVGMNGSRMAQPQVQQGYPANSQNVSQMGPYLGPDGSNMTQSQGVILPANYNPAASRGQPDASSQGTDPTTSPKEKRGWSLFGNR